MNKNNFSFWTPVEITKGKDESGKNVMKLGGIASTFDEDADGEFLDPNGFDIDDFEKIGLVNWHHMAKDQPATIVGEPTRVELRPEGFYVETTLYPSSKVARDVWELAQTLAKDSKTRKLGYSVEGQVVERGSEDENHPDYNIVKKAKITGLAITHMPKNPKTFAEIIKSFQSGSLSGETTTGVHDEEEESGMSTKKGKALIKESVDKDLKNLQKSFRIGELDENHTIDKIFEIFTDINIQKANNIFTILKAMKNNKVTNNQIEKAMSALGLSYDENNPFLVKGEESEENPSEVRTETSAARKIRESGLSHSDLMNKIAKLSEDEEEEIEEEEIEENEEKDEIKKAVSGNINKAIVNIISKKIEKSQKDNFQQNKAIATLIKANSEQLQKSYEANVELKGHLEEQKNIIAQQNRIIKSLADTLSSTPQPRKSLVKGFSEKESFQKGREEAPQGTVLSMSKNYKQVLDLVDGMTFAKGNFDSELSKATTTFESTKVLPENIISRIKQETGITIIG